MTFKTGGNVNPDRIFDIKDFLNYDFEIPNLFETPKHFQMK
jgi:hypothetical protein